MLPSSGRSGPAAAEQLPSRLESPLKEARRCVSIKLVPLRGGRRRTARAGPGGCFGSSREQRHTRTPSAPLPRPPGSAEGARSPNGDPATLVGALKCPPSTSPGGRLVTLYEQSAPKASFAQVATAMTEPSGAFQVTPPVFMTSSVFYAVVEGAQSARKAIRVTAAITALPPTPAEEHSCPPAVAVNLASSTGHIRRHGQSRSPRARSSCFSVRTPRPTKNGIAFRHLRRSTQQNGEYSITHTFAVPGDASLRVVVHPHKLNVGAASTRCPTRSRKPRIRRSRSKARPTR